LSVALIDTAGVHESIDPIEQEGMSRTLGATHVADLLWVVVDRSRPLSEDDRRVLEQTKGRRRILVANKGDLPAQCSADAFDNRDELVVVSAKMREGLDRLTTITVRLLAGTEQMKDTPAITNIRHADLLQRARGALERSALGIAAAQPEELPLIDLHDAIAALQEVTGQRSTDDLLGRIFERFCIGK
jgi:tRNA modification GTPase